MARVDLHSHTMYSPDSRMRFDQIADACERAGITVLATTDHNTVDGAIAFQRWCRDHDRSLEIIVGEEVMTPKGEVIGLYLNETIPKGTPLLDAIDMIRDQGGLFLLEHPFDPMRHGLDEISHTLEPDIIEVFNARTRLRRSNEKALALAQEKGTPQVACSDAHSPGEFGSAYTDTPDFDAADPQALLAALRNGVHHTTTSPPWVSVHSVLAKALHKLGL